MKAILVTAALAAAMTGVASAKGRPPTGNGIETPGTAGWPAVAAQLAKNIARDSFAREYDRVWKYLHPMYRQAVSQSHWQRCQGSHPAAPRTVTVTKVSVASATELPVRLSLLGRKNVQEIQLAVQFRSPSAAGTQVAVLYTFWLKEKSTWSAVWLSDEYSAYKAGRCYVTPQGPPLY